jgi:hypothetical protein
MVQDDMYLAIGHQDAFHLQRLEMREQTSDAQTGASRRPHGSARPATERVTGTAADQQLCTLAWTPRTTG